MLRRFKICSYNFRLCSCQNIGEFFVFHAVAALELCGMNFAWVWGEGYDLRQWPLKKYGRPLHPWSGSCASTCCDDGTWLRWNETCNQKCFIWFGALWSPDFYEAHYLCAKVNSPSFSQNSPQWVLFSETVLSKQSSARFLIRERLNCEVQTVN